VDADVIVDPTLVILNNNLYIILIDKDMKPLNLDNRPCSPISSNCVIWQGPDIPCIKLCAGDSVSDVVFKLATELCTIMDQLNVTNYDLSCLGINSCPPEDFHALIQLLINKICEANGITVTEGKALGCPDCVVSVAPCFVEGIQTTMQLVDYVQMIANRVCSILDQITAINNELVVINDTLTDLQFQIDNLPVYTLPSIPADCILPAGNYPLDQVLNALMNNDTLGYCSLLTATGTPAQIVSGVLSQCIADGDPSLASLAAGDSPVQSFSTYYAGSWVNNPSLTTYPTVANAIKNIWIAICDIYSYLGSLPTTVVEAGEGITVTSTVVGNETTYTVTNDYLETFQAVLVINSSWQPTCGIINSIFPGNVTAPGAPTFGGTPSSYKGVNNGKPIIRYNVVTSNSITVTPTATVGGYVSAGCMPPFSFGTFDNETGIFTITDPGTYLIHAMIHLKSQNNTSDAFWSGDPTTHTLIASPLTDPPTTYTLNDNFTNTGSFLIGLHPSNDTDTYVAQGQTLIPGIDRCVEISVSRIITTTIPRAVRVKVLNTTNRDYDGTVYPNSDAILFSIVKLRNNLTDIDCYNPV
jgi:hypothetical protein